MTETPKEQTNVKTFTSEGLPIDDSEFSIDGHRIVSDVQSTGRFARSRANATGKLREVIRRVQRA